MNLTRRQFNAAAAATLWLPSWLLPRPRVRHIDLAPFCDDDDWQGNRFNCTKPFHQEGMNYATDKRIAVRTGLPVDLGESPESVRLPPACGLPWKHDGYRGWRNWSAGQHVKAKSDYGLDCPRCFGRGRIGEDVERCVRCDGDGQVPVFGGGEHDFTCKPCGCFNGWTGGQKCGHCDGKGTVDFEVDLAGCHVAPAYYAKVAALGNIEYCIVPTHVCFSVIQQKTLSLSNIVLFRGQDVEGMLCPLER